MSYQDVISKQAPVNWFREPEGDSDQKRFDYVLGIMQSQFPGNYTIEEYYDPSQMMMRFRLKFDSEQDEVWFKLKYQ